ncbi:hypothetical protein F4805DRAFT_456313 [Annulohypoxylon moriforme]|nr:hypothetical protein F4805DRAFT_456313 [Annulohypoxylon moriforme]
MSGPIKTIARILESAGSNALNNNELSLLTVNGTRLVENIYDGEALKDQRKVADGVKSGSFAVYIISQSNAHILYISNDNSLEASEFDSDSDEWEETELQGLGELTVHPKSKLATATLHEIILVFYQRADGTINSILLDQADSATKGWSEGFAIPGDAQTGTPISAFSTDTALVVSFIGKDGSVHVHSRDLQSGDWKDIILKNSSWNDTVTNMVVSQDIETGGFEVFALVNTNVDRVKNDGTRSTLGQILSGKFVPTTQAEAGDIYVYGNNYGTITNYGNYPYNNYGGGYGCYRIPVCRPVCRPYWC